MIAACPRDYIESLRTTAEAEGSTQEARTWNWLLGSNILFEIPQDQALLHITEVRKQLGELAVVVDEC